MYRILVNTGLVHFLPYGLQNQVYRALVPSEFGVKLVDYSGGDLLTRHLQRIISYEYEIEHYQNRKFQHPYNFIVSNEFEVKPHLENLCKYEFVSKNNTMIEFYVVMPVPHSNTIELYFKNYDWDVVSFLQSIAHRRNNQFNLLTLERDRWEYISPGTVHIKYYYAFETTVGDSIEFAALQDLCDIYDRSIPFNYHIYGGIEIDRKKLVYAIGIYLGKSVYMINCKMIACVDIIFEEVENGSIVLFIDFDECAQHQLVDAANSRNFLCFIITDGPILDQQMQKRLTHAVQLQAPEEEEFYRELISLAYGSGKLVSDTSPYRDINSILTGRTHVHELKKESEKILSAMESNEKNKATLTEIHEIASMARDKNLLMDEFTEICLRNLSADDVMQKIKDDIKIITIETLEEQEDDELMQIYQ